MLAERARIVMFRPDRKELPIADHDVQEKVVEQPRAIQAEPVTEAVRERQNQFREPTRLEVGLTEGDGLYRLPSR